MGRKFRASWRVCVCVCVLCVRALCFVCSLVYVVFACVYFVCLCALCMLCVCWEVVSALLQGASAAGVKAVRKSKGG